MGGEDWSYDKKSKRTSGKGSGWRESDRSKPYIYEKPSTTFPPPPPPPVHYEIPYQPQEPQYYYPPQPTLPRIIGRRIIIFVVTLLGNVLLWILSLAAISFVGFREPLLVPMVPVLESIGVLALVMIELSEGNSLIFDNGDFLAFKVASILSVMGGLLIALATKS